MFKSPLIWAVRPKESMQLISLHRMIKQVFIGNLV